MSMWCLGHARSTRFDGECQFHVPRYGAESLAAMQNTGKFWPAWVASYRDYVKMHWAWTLPLFFLFGLVYVPLKLVLTLTLAPDPKKP